MMNTAANYITHLSLQHTLGEVTATDIFDLMYWCKDYERRNKFPATLLNRFAIGFYQIHQGMSWKDGGINKYESYAASVLHLMMVAVRLDLPIEDYVKIGLKEYPLYLMENECYHLLKNLSAAQQMLFYANKNNKTKRSSRYSPDKLNQYLSRAIFILISIIPPELRTECFEKASAIMTKELK